MECHLPYLCLRRSRHIFIFRRQLDLVPYLMIHPRNRLRLDILINDALLENVIYPIQCAGPHNGFIETAKAILSLWTHPGRQLEVSEIAIAELNQLPDDDIVEALKGLRKPKRYVQGTGGHKLTMRVIFTKLDDNHSHETQALLDSGCTGS